MITQPSPFHRVAVLAYSILAYASFLVSFAYAIGFMGGFLVPRSLDSAPTRAVGPALLINAALLIVFALQHSVMARPAFKRMLTRYIPESAERATYVLMSSVALGLVFWLWEPMGGEVWHVQSPLWRGLLYAGYAAGLALVFVATLMLNHFDLFGLRQAWKHFRQERYVPLKFATPGLYRYIRHPLYLGWITSFWCVPTMSVAHLLFAVMTTAYIFAAVQLEENDLIAVHGAEYLDYARKTPMLVPNLARRVEEDAHQL